MSGWLCDSGFLGGWPSVFYVLGGLLLVWCVAWFLLVSDYPEVHPRISPVEKNYLMRRCRVKKKEVGQGKAFR